MRDFQNKNKRKSIFQSIPVLVFLFVLMILFALGMLDFARRAQDAYRNRKIAEERIVELENRKNKLENDLNELNTDLGKERVFRENYGLGRPGEGVIVVVDEEAPDQNLDDQKYGFWAYIKDLLAN